MELAAAFGAGAISSIGPCAAPRLVAIVATGESPKTALRIGRTVAFVAGVCLGYLTIGTIAGAIGYVATFAAPLYAVASLTFAIIGVVSILNARPHVECIHEPRALSYGALFLAGFASAILPSPCCTPAIALIATTSVAGSQANAAAWIGAFALGHALPLLAAGAGAARFRSWMRAFEPAMAIVGGALMLALSAYYGMLV